MVTTLLRERMRQAMRIRNLSARTEQIYLHSVALGKPFGCLLGLEIEVVFTGAYFHLNRFCLGSV